MAVLEEKKEREAALNEAREASEEVERGGRTVKGTGCLG